jgi:tetratricopeptide (TPR) repeat protein
MSNNRLEQLISILGQGSKDPFIRYAIATEYLKEGKVSLALEFYEDLIENNAEYIGTYYHLGKLYDNLGRKEDAKLTFEKGIKIAKESQNLHALSELQQIHQNLLLELDDE